jgi:cytochrome c biogenesis protein CcdA
MKYLKYFLIGFTAILFLVITPSTSVTAVDEERVAVYFKEKYCIVCQSLAGQVGTIYTESDDYIKKLEEQGVTVYIYTVDDLSETAPDFAYTDQDGKEIIPTSADLFKAFNTTYGFNEGTVPVIYVSDTYFEGYSSITRSIDNMEIYNLSVGQLSEVNVVEGQIFTDLTGFLGFITVLGAGLLDGFNPCAIALLLLFVSLLGFSENKKVLMLVSIVYISALFTSYYFIGRFFMSTILKYQSQISVVGSIINWFIFLLCSFLFIINFYDYLQARNEKYGNIKNQLPKWVQKMNKKIVKTFTGAMNKDEEKGLFPILLLTFVLGITLSVTELVCTGQIYLGILYGITTLESGYANILLLFYNLMFVLPLIIIAVVSIRSKGIMGVSNWIREHMKHIKLANSILFLFISLYFMSRIPLFSPIFEPFRDFILFVKRSFE